MQIKIDELNEKFKKANQEIRITSYQSSYLPGKARKQFVGLGFNNGFVITNLIEAQKIIRQLLATDEIIFFANDICSGDVVRAKSAIKEYRSKIASANGKKAKGAGTNKKGRIPWNKNVKTGHAPWNKGKTKETCEKVKRNLSDSRRGVKNPMYGKTVSDDAKLKQSVSLKAKILRGEWTPNVHNSNTHWDATYNGKKFRSSWEALFQHLHPSAEFEKIRVTYFDTRLKKDRIYILDFLDVSCKKIYEIKPKSKKYTLLDKEKAAISWANDNGYEFVIITEEYFLANADRICLDGFDPETANKIKKLLTYEID